jgi:hypothetical protein
MPKTSWNANPGITQLNKPQMICQHCGTVQWTYFLNEMAAPELQPHEPQTSTHQDSETRSVKKTFQKTSMIGGSTHHGREALILSKSGHPMETRQ